MIFKQGKLSASNFLFLIELFKMFLTVYQSRNSKIHRAEPKRFESNISCSVSQVYLLPSLLHWRWWPVPHFREYNKCYMQLFFLFGRHQYQFNELDCILFPLDYSLCHSSRAKYHKLHNNHETMKQQLTFNYSPT